MRLFKLKFLSALHVDSRGSGEPEASDEFIHSDTLSAAICLSRAAVFPAETDQAYFDQPRFKVSSAFPYVEDLLFFPKPLWGIWKQGKDLEPHQRKKIKDIRWLSKTLFEQILSGNQIEFTDIQMLPCGLAVSKEEYQAHPKIKGFKAWETSERQRVSVDRFGLQSEGEGLLFFFALQFFAPISGLYFLADLEPSESEKFRPALDFLGDSGIGADRNSGLGHFQIIGDSDVTLPDVKNPDGWVTLSLFNPDKQKDSIPDLTQKTAYGLAVRSGWISNSTLGRPPVRVFTEGSYFSAKPTGRVIPMLEHARKQFALPIDHHSARDFRALCLPCREPEQFKEKQP